MFMLFQERQTQPFPASFCNNLLLLLRGALENLGVTVLGRGTNKNFTHQEFSPI